MARRHERTHSTRRLIRAGVPQGSTLSLCCTPRTQTIYRDRHRLASNSRYSRTIPRSFTEIGIGAPDSPSSLQRAIDELGQWFRKWRIEVNPDRSAAIQFKYGRIEAILRHRGITSQCALRAAVDYQPPHPTHLSVGHETYLPIHLTLLQRQLKALMTSTTRMTDLEREPTRDGFLRHPMPRRLPPGVVHSACHAPSALACAVRPHSVKLSKSSDLSSDSSRPTK
ncbi:hypothetical protein EVAR_87677_1 [Eumeta japonica]|uniref:Uncharacterized protein n=1 Tax=Eumeta variegata TaxID=151549 RepID=A0A4C1XKS0_EUMVA|nr:hypothetical protein EVAR_87677_1 [Eumeta japonica]